MSQPKPPAPQVTGEEASCVASPLLLVLSLPPRLLKLPTIAVSLLSCLTCTHPPLFYPPPRLFRAFFGPPIIIFFPDRQVHELHVSRIYTYGDLKRPSCRPAYGDRKKKKASVTALWCATNLAFCCKSNERWSPAWGRKKRRGVERISGRWTVPGPFLFRFFLPSSGWLMHRPGVYIRKPPDFPFVFGSRIHRFTCRATRGVQQSVQQHILFIYCRILSQTVQHAFVWECWHATRCHKMWYSKYHDKCNAKCWKFVLLHQQK